MTEYKKYIVGPIIERVYATNWRQISAILLVAAATTGLGYAATYTSHVINWVNRNLNTPFSSSVSCTDMAVLTDSSLRQSHSFTAGVELNGETCVLP